MEMDPMKIGPMKTRLIPRGGLAVKLLIPVGVVLFVSIFIWSHFSIRYQERLLIDKAVSGVDKFCNYVL